MCFQKKYSKINIMYFYRKYSKINIMFFQSFSIGKTLGKI